MQQGNQTIGILIFWMFLSFSHETCSSYMLRLKPRFDRCFTFPFQILPYQFQFIKKGYRLAFQFQSSPNKASRLRRLLMRSKNAKSKRLSELKQAARHAGWNVAPKSNSGHEKEDSGPLILATSFSMLFDLCIHLPKHMVSHLELLTSFIELFLLGVLSKPTQRCGVSWIFPFEKTSPQQPRPGHGWPR